MIDLQVVYIREVVPALAIDFVSMLRVRRVSLAGLLDVQVDGQSVPFMPTIDDELLVAIPGDESFVTVTNVRLVYDESVGGGTRVVLRGEGLASTGDGQLVEDPAILRLEGDGFAEAVEVFVNDRSQEFTILSSSSILVTIPSSATTISKVEVVVDKSRVSRNSVFQHTVGTNPRTISGQFKVIQQFLRVLLTTPGSDAFDRDAPAGNMQNWLSILTPGNNKQSLVSKIVLNVATTAAKFVVAQSRTNLPNNEKAAAIDVVDIDFDESNQTRVGLSLRVRTLDQQSSVFGVLLGTIDSLSNSITG